MADVAQRYVFGPYHKVGGALVTAPKIYHYEPGTTVLKTAWTGRDKAGESPNPVDGDATGIASFFFDGLYKIVVKDSDEVTLYTWDNFSVGPIFEYLVSSVVWDPASLVDGAGASSPGITITGAAFGDAVLVLPPYDMQGLIYFGYVSLADTVKIHVQNETTGTVDLASGTWKLRVLKG